MARKSQYEKTDIQQQFSHKWDVAVYLRLSRDDGDKLESDSIENQRDMITSFIDKTPHEFSVYDIYIDDGFTGTNFNRPSFKRMIADMENGLINCIIVKDLSRLGRDYIEMGNYQENIFPKYNLRFIAINDHVDTHLNKDKSNNMIIPFKNLINQQYADDISQKVRSALTTKRQRGEFIGAFAPYGYLKSPEDKHKLILDPVAAPIVKRIYDMFINGTAKLTIAYALNADGIQCPSEHKKSLGLNYNNPRKLGSTVYWTITSINAILRHQIYTGDMVQNTQGTDNYRSKKNKRKDKSEWIVVPNTHEPIVDRETWNTVQKLLQSDIKKSQYDGEIHLFAGIVKCDKCKRAIVKRIHYDKNKNKRYTLVCATYKYYGKDTCSSHSIKYEEFEQNVLDDLQYQIDQYTRVDAYLSNQKYVDDKLKRHKTQQNQIISISNKIVQLQQRKDGLYDDYKDEILTKEEYLRMKNSYENEIQQCTDNLNVLKETIRQSQDVDEEYKIWSDKLSEYKGIEKLTRDVVVSTIDHIVLYDDKTIDVIYKFKPIK